MPPLYKYLSADRISYLDNELLRFTQPSDLNDPFECLPNIDLDPKLFLKGVLERTKPALEQKVTGKKKWEQREQKKAIKKARKQLERDYTKDQDHLPKRYLARYLKHANARIGIFSLTNKWNNSLMWSHYTNSHMGFCVGFNRSHSFFQQQKTDRNDIGKLVDISYSKERIKLNVNDGLEIIPELFEHKSIDWAYEEEVRLIRELSNCTEEIDKGDELPLCLFRVPHEAVSEVVAGANASDGLISDLKKFTDKHKIPLYRTNISIREYDLDREKI
jgi:ribosomal protein S18